MPAANKKGQKTSDNDSNLLTPIAMEEVFPHKKQDEKSHDGDKNLIKKGFQWIAQFTPTDYHTLLFKQYIMAGLKKYDNDGLRFFETLDLSKRLRLQQLFLRKVGDCRNLDPHGTIKVGLVDTGMAKVEKNSNLECVEMNYAGIDYDDVDYASRKLDALKWALSRSGVEEKVPYVRK